VSIDIRAYHPDDAATLFAIFVEAVRIGAATHYTPAQCLAWAPDTDMPSNWPDRLASLETWVAKADSEIGCEIAGFMAATPQGYVDLAFVRPRWMGRSVAQALYECVLERARRDKLTHLTTHASLLARPFFARQGWQVDATEMIDRNGEVLRRFAMSVNLGETP